MHSSCLKYGIVLIAISAFGFNTLNAGNVAYSNNDGKKKKTITTTSHGTVVKQSKPNMYVRFFNKVYNKYANRPVPHHKQLPSIRVKPERHLSHTK